MEDARRNAWSLEGSWRNVSKAFNVPIIVNKIFIIIGIGCGGSKDYTTKHIMIGLRFHALKMCWMGTRLQIRVNMETHFRIKDKPQRWI